jgi:hypothetical protein
MIFYCNYSFHSFIYVILTYYTCSPSSAIPAFLSARHVFQNVQNSPMSVDDSTPVFQWTNILRDLWDCFVVHNYDIRRFTDMRAPFELEGGGDVGLYV